MHAPPTPRPAPGRLQLSAARISTLVARPARRTSCRATADTEEAPAGSAPGARFADLNAGIATFYDASTGLWERVWGDHLHHGYYPPGSPPKSNRQAQEDMIDESLRWAGITGATKVSGRPPSLLYSVR